MGSSTVAELVPPETTLFNEQILVEIPLTQNPFSTGSGKKKDGSVKVPEEKLVW